MKVSIAIIAVVYVVITCLLSALIHTAPETQLPVRQVEQRAQDALYAAQPPMIVKTTPVGTGTYNPQLSEQVR